MKKLMFHSFLLIIGFVLTTDYLQSQPIQFFDTVKVFRQSEIYNYSNPVFDNHISFLFQVDSTKVAFIKSDSVQSSIIVSNFDFHSDYPEHEIVNDTSTKKSVSISSDLIVWNSNLNGSFNIYFSRFNNGTYTNPEQLTFNSSDDLNLSVYKNLDAACLIFERDSNIYVMFYRNNIWETEILITNQDSGRYYSPIVGNGYIAYSEKSEKGFKNYWHYVNFNNGTINNKRLYSESTLALKTNSNVKSLYESFLTFEKRDSVSSKVYFMEVWNWGTPYEIGEEISGDKYSLKSSQFGIIVDNPRGAYDYYFTFANERNDSMFIIIRDLYTHWFNNRTRSFPVQHKSPNFNFDISLPVFDNFLSSGKYRIRVIWEDIINGKSVLLESNGYDDLTNLSTNSSAIPEKFNLHQNFPNPFNPTTTISFDIPHASDVKLTVYDALGRTVATLVNERLNAGSYNYQFSIDNFQMGSGVYFYKLQAGEFVETKRMVLIK